MAKPADEEDGWEWKRKEDESRFMTARSGDHLMCPFQCDLCVFRNIYQRDPWENDVADRKMMVFIRRMNLDAFWGREASTVKANAGVLRKGLKICVDAKMPAPYLPLGPFPVRDTLGYGVAFQMLTNSIGKGAYASYTQFATIRKLRSVYSNAYEASAVGASDSLRFVSSTARTSGHLSSCPTESLWFTRFTLGCRKRMGQIVKQDMGISIEVFMALLEEFRIRIAAAEGEAKTELICVKAYAVLCYCGSLRGNEGFMLDLKELIYCIPKGKSANPAHVIAPLRGRFKNEVGDREHQVVLPPETDSGIRPREALEDLVRVRRAQGRVKGPAFCGMNGRVVKSSVYEMIILDALAGVQARRPDLIDSDANVYEEYGINRSFRRGSTTRARIVNVSGPDIDVINRWRKIEEAKGSKPSQNMRDHYSEIRQMVPALLRYPQAL